MNIFCLLAQDDEYEVDPEWEHYISMDQWLIEDSTKIEEGSIYSAQNIFSFS